MNRACQRHTHHRLGLADRRVNSVVPQPSAVARMMPTLKWFAHPRSGGSTYSPAPWLLAHAYVQCRSNKGAPGVDGQDFTDIDAYGVQRWLGELALALRLETYRPAPIRRVFIPKANGKLRPLGIFWRAKHALAARCDRRTIASS